MDTLVFSYALGATPRARDFHPLETCPCRAHHNGPLEREDAREPRGFSRRELSEAESFLLLLQLPSSTQLIGYQRS